MRRFAIPFFLVLSVLAGAIYQLPWHVDPPTPSATPAVANRPTASRRDNVGPAAVTEKGCFVSIPASGQLTSYGAGSDGELQSGGTRGYVDNGDGTILDANTGLIWEKKAHYENLDVNCTSVDICPDPHDADNRYLWTVTESAMDGPIVTVFLEQLNHRCENDTRVACTQDHDCSAIGGQCGFAGQSDWRIPNWKELLSIVNFEVIGPSVGEAFNAACTENCTVEECSCTVPNVHWTSNTTLEDPTWAGYVSFYDGNVHADTKTHAFFVRAVRGGTPVATPACDRFLPRSGQTISYGPASDGSVRAGGELRYRDNQDGTLTDENTGLMWEKKSAYENNDIDCDSIDECPNPHDGDNRYTWGSGEGLDGGVASLFLSQLNQRCETNAKIECTSDEDCSSEGGRCGFAGHRDWRLPQVKELHSIVDYGRPVPSVSEAFHRECSEKCDVSSCSCTARGHHWTSTTYPGDPTWAQFVGFFDGNVFAEAKTEYRHVRAVRGGN